MKIFTIGSSRKTSAVFFHRLQRAGVKKVVDVRLYNRSAKAAFTNRDDLAYFLRVICSADYEHMPALAPTKEILHAYKEGMMPWKEFERRFLALMQEREIEKKLDPEQLDGACLLCSEDKPHFCHRRLVAEYLKEKWGDVTIVHL